MALDGTVKIPGIGPVSKKGAVYGTLAVAVAGGGIWLYRRRHAAPGAAAPAAAAAGTGTVTDPAGNTCAAVSPATGFCPGTAEDLAAQQGSAYNTSQLGGGLAGYYYGTGAAVQQTAPGPGNFADNAEWSQYVIGYLTQNLNANAGALGDALGKYLAGKEVTPAENKLIEEAIAVGERPPQAGPGGYPPSIRLGTGPGPQPKKVKVPDVIGLSYREAAAMVRAAGLKPHQQGPGKIVQQRPAAETEVSRGSTVTLFGANK